MTHADQVRQVAKNIGHDCVRLCLGAPSWECERFGHRCIATCPACALDAIAASMDCADVNREAAAR